VTESAFVYDFMPSGERLAKMNVLSGATTWSMFDGPDVAADYATSPSSPAFSLEASYVNGLGIDSKIARIHPGGAKFFYTGDALGSATQLVNSSQSVVNQYFTTAWGEDLLDQRPVADRYGFTQRENDPESQLMHFRARSYDPRTGRFVQKDPVLMRRAHEHYVYASVNPVDRTDSLGLQDEKEWRDFERKVRDWEERDRRDQRRRFVASYASPQEGEYAWINQFGGSHADKQWLMEYSTYRLSRGAGERFAYRPEDYLDLVERDFQRLKIYSVLGTAAGATFVSAFGGTVAATRSGFWIFGRFAAWRAAATASGTGGGATIATQRALERRSEIFRQVLPALRRLHSDETILKSNKSGFGYWSKQSTEAIVRSLKPGSLEPLRTYSDGTVIQGNTRIMILQRRGFDVNSLPRVTEQKIRPSGTILD